MSKSNNSNNNNEKRIKKIDKTSHDRRMVKDMLKEGNFDGVYDYEEEKNFLKTKKRTNYD